MRQTLALGNAEEVDRGQIMLGLICSVRLFNSLLNILRNHGKFLNKVIFNNKNDDNHENSKFLYSFTMHQAVFCSTRVNI